MKNKDKKKIVAPPPVSISAEEYNALISKLEFNDTTRNNLLTFAFTAVLALLGVIFALENPIQPEICLLPYLLIIPFTARITYYRVSSAHIDSFLKCFDPNRSVFKWGSTEVPEKHSWVYHIIAWLVNHEMVMLSILVGVAYCYQYYVVKGYESYQDYLWLVLPLVAIVIVFLISNSTKKYKKLYEHFMPAWNDYKEKNPPIIEESKNEK